MTDQIKAFDKATAKELAKEIEATLLGIADRYGIQIKAGGGSFTNSSLTFKLECAVIGDNGEVQSREVEDFKRFANVYGLAADDLGKEFASNGKRFKITGLRTKARTKPILATNVQDGKLYIFAAESVARKLHPMASV